METRPRVLIDTCVLYPTVMREMVLGVAARGAFEPIWSAGRDRTAARQLAGGRTRGLPQPTGAALVAGCE